MCVWTKKRGSMNAVVLMATPCPKSLHGKGEKWIARNILQGLDSRQPMTERKVGFTKNTAMRHRRVGGRAVTVTAMLHRQRYRVIEKGKD